MIAPEEQFVKGLFCGEGPLKDFEGTRPWPPILSGWFPSSFHGKPCMRLGYCPYGVLVEEFPLRHGSDESCRCSLFGHDCPVYYVAEDVIEGE